MIIVIRQIESDLAVLFLDDMKIVDKPFSGRRDDLFAPNGTRQREIRLHQFSRVFF